MMNQEEMKKWIDTIENTANDCMTAVRLIVPQIEKLRNDLIIQQKYVLECQTTVIEFIKRNEK